MSLVYGSICSGIEAATVAWEPLGWNASFYSEIDKFPRELLKYRYPNVPLHGDFTTIQKDEYEKIDVLVGGTPCQAFSVAGLRKGLDDDRGKLTPEFVKLATRLQPRVIVWENVPGVLSIDGGKAFSSFLGAMAECGYGFAYRVLDAQNFGVPQRRRRVFVVGYIGDWRCAAQILFESESLRRDIKKSRKKREGIAGYSPSGFAEYSESKKGTGLRSSGGDLGGGSENLVCGTLNARDHKGIDTFSIEEGKYAICFEPGILKREGGDSRVSEEVCPTLRSQMGDNQPAVAKNAQVRRLTPIECERLQGFPDNYTQIPWRGKDAIDCPDGHRYKALGNSMACPVMHWIGARIDKALNQQ